MTLDQFVQQFAEQFDETPANQFTPATDYKSLDEWGSLTTLGVITMVDAEMEKRITASNLLACTTIEELYNFIQRI
ncbi:MAG: acyl carrier protein [Bacteroidales bacterium]|nr:acyl carrier protein [Bacteroidales bacterium]